MRQDLNIKSSIATVGLAVLMSMLSVSVHAAFNASECTEAGGTVITRNVNGATGAPTTCTADKCPATVKTFCKSGQSMNWWSAFNWCASISGSLASFSAMCPAVPTASNNVTGACPGLQGKGDSWVWSSLGYGSHLAIIVNLSSGAVNGHIRNGSHYALCE